MQNIPQTFLLFEPLALETHLYFGKNRRQQLQTHTRVRGGRNHSTKLKLDKSRTHKTKKIRTTHKRRNYSQRRGGLGTQD